MLKASLSSTNAAVRGQTQLLADFRTKRRHFFRPIFPVPTSIQRSLAHLFHNLSWLDDKALLLTCDLGKIATKEKNYNSKAKQKRPFFQMDRIWIKDIKKQVREPRMNRPNPEMIPVRITSKLFTLIELLFIRHKKSRTVAQTRSLRRRGKSCFKTPIELAPSCGSQRQ